MTTPGEAHWKEMVAHLGARVGMTPLDVEAATEGRVKAADVQEILVRAAAQHARDQAAAGDDRAEAGSKDQSSENQ